MNDVIVPSDQLIDENEFKTYVQLTAYIDALFGYTNRSDQAIKHKLNLKEQLQLAEQNGLPNVPPTRILPKKPWRVDMEKMAKLHASILERKRAVYGTTI